MTTGKTRSIPYKWLVLLTLSIGTFMATLDFSIVNMSFPRLTEVFDTEPSIVLWVSVIYLLVSVGLMLSLSRLGDVFGRKKIYCLGFSVFTVGLMLCSLSQSVTQLILARVFQGVGAAMTIGLGTAILVSAFPAEERGKAMGINSAVVSAGLLSGPAFGGLLLDAFDWRAVFFLRIPIGIIGLIMALSILKEQKEPVTNFNFDIGGAATLFGSLATMLLFFNLGGRFGFLSGWTLILGASALLLATAFLILERRATHPILDLRLFQNRLFAAANISLGIIFLAQASMTFLIPFFLIQGTGRSASAAGLLVALSPLSMLLVAPLSGWSSDKIGPRLLCTIGVSLTSLSLFLLSRLNIDSSTAEISSRLALAGLGMGLFTSPNNSSIMGSVPRDKLSTASAMIATVRQTTTASGTAIAGTIFASRQAFYSTQLASNNLNPILQKLALVNSVRDTLVIAAIVCAIGVFTSLARGKHKPPSPIAARKEKESP